MKPPKPHVGRDLLWFWRGQPGCFAPRREKYCILGKDYLKERGNSNYQLLEESLLIGPKGIGCTDVPVWSHGNSPKARQSLSRYLSGLSLRFLRGCCGWIDFNAAAVDVSSLNSLLTPKLFLHIFTFTERKGSSRMNCWSVQPLLGCQRMRSAATACFNTAMSASGLGFPWCVCVHCFLWQGREKKPMHHEVPVASSSSSNIVPSLRVEAIQGPLPLLSLLKIAGNGNHTTILSLKHNSAPGKVRQWFRSFHLVEALASWHASRALIGWRDKAVPVLFSFVLSNEIKITSPIYIYIGTHSGKNMYSRAYCKSTIFSYVLMFSINVRSWKWWDATRTHAHTPRCIT